MGKTLNKLILESLSDDVLTFKSKNNDLFYLTFLFDEKGILSKVINKWDVKTLDWFGLANKKEIIQYYTKYFPEFYISNTPITESEKTLLGSKVKTSDNREGAVVDVNPMADLYTVELYNKYKVNKTNPVYRRKELTVISSDKISDDSYVLYNPTNKKFININKSKGTTNYTSDKDKTSFYNSQNDAYKDSVKHHKQIMDMVNFKNDLKIVQLKTVIK